jgi:hypothetical protein
LDLLVLLHGSHCEFEFFFVWFLSDAQSCNQMTRYVGQKNSSDLLRKSEPINLRFFWWPDSKSQTAASILYKFLAAVTTASRQRQSGGFHTMPQGCAGSVTKKLLCLCYSHCYSHKALYSNNQQAQASPPTEAINLHPAYSDAAFSIYKTANVEQDKE